MTGKSNSACSNQVGIAGPSVDNPSFVVSLDIGSEKITSAILRPDRCSGYQPHPC